MNQPVSSFVSEGNVRAYSVKKSHEYKLLKENIKKIGIKTPITYRVNDDGKNVIINGHQRFEIAKSLGFEDIPAFEMNGVDDVTAQIATNLFTVPMNHMDGAKAIMDLHKNGVTPTKKDLSTLFGKNNNWINVSLALTNVSPLLSSYIKTEREGFAQGVTEELQSISQSNIESQERAMFQILHRDNDLEMSSYKDMNQKWFNEEVDDFGWGDDTFANFLNKVANTLMDDGTRFESICNIVGEDTFREYEKEMGVEYEYQDGLFAEYNDNQWCKDEEFLYNLFYTHTDIGAYLFNIELPIRNHGWWGNELQNRKFNFNFANKLSTFKKNIANDSEVKFSQIELLAWDGNILNPYVEYKVLSENETSKQSSKKEVKEPNFSLLYNKLNKVVAPVVDSYMKTDVRAQLDEQNENGLYIALKWLLDVNTSHSIRYAHMKKDDDNASLLRRCLYHWYDVYYAYADFNQIASLCKELNLDSLDTVVKLRYKENADFRKEYLSCFPVSVLKEKLPDFKGTKSELVTKLAEKSTTKPLMFDYCMTNNGSGGDSLGSYLPKD
jgi:ParB/RepB/Spo0J family partition protein